MSETPDTPSVREARQSAIDLATTYAPSEVWSDAEIAEVMDTLISAVRAERDAEIRGMVEGMRVDDKASILNRAVDAVLALLGSEGQ